MYSNLLVFILLSFLYAPRCGNKIICIPNSWMCDGKNDCGGKNPGWDEDPVRCANITCAGTEFRCSGGRCIPGGWRCDGEADCEDDSDELGCSNKNATCPSNLFTCTNGK